MVELVKQDFNKNKEQYLNTASILQTHLPCKCTIDHVGSTAIPDMYGKSIIDILVGVSGEEDFALVHDTLVSLGYYPSTHSKTDIYEFFASSTSETKDGDTHIHLVIRDTDRYEDFICLRDYLLSHPDEAMAYSNHKKHIIATQGTDRTAYRQTKSAYVTALIEKSHIWKENK